MNRGPWNVIMGQCIVIMGPWNVNRGLSNVIMGQLNVIMGPWNVIMGPCRCDYGTV